eukprot:14107248-Alexandrium_andersonii.AAC.1
MPLSLFVQLLGLIGMYLVQPRHPPRWGANCRVPARGGGERAREGGGLGGGGWDVGARGCVPTRVPATLRPTPALL